MSYLLLVVEPVEQRESRIQEEGRETYLQMGEFANDKGSRSVTGV